MHQYSADESPWGGAEEAQAYQELLLVVFGQQLKLRLVQSV